MEPIQFIFHSLPKKGNLSDFFISSSSFVTHICFCFPLLSVGDPTKFKRIHVGKWLVVMKSDPLLKTLEASRPAPLGWSLPSTRHFPSTQEQSLVSIGWSWLHQSQWDIEIICTGKWIKKGKKQLIPMRLEKYGKHGLLHLCAIIQGYWMFYCPWTLLCFALLSCLSKWLRSRGRRGGFTWALGGPEET